ncbi:hypothetical protein H696_02487 [Fonticula alba]|uniref:BolA protein n=1 Tax=Fonticula alba TaxID=691883 RepID=A0A058ZC88_FONAL|nr:hypothetical protein H696_02487 [Fonticula alba]KCV71548.1 hypothetical protein H696_02487 [Fonticula alba]|eukprot:XP_009494671.1 hypothetical protein H696_02487 [Fonticula alba]
MTPLARHRAVHAALQEVMPKVHAITINALTPAVYAKQQQKAQE